MSVLTPTCYSKRITVVSPPILFGEGIRVILLDVDNTLTTHGSPDFADDVRQWLAEAKTVGLRPIIVSNNRRTRVVPFASKLDLPCISWAWKPLPFGYLRAMKRLGATRKETVVIGDQLFTDILGASCLGIQTILCQPIQPEDGPFFRFKRRLERRILRKVSPIAHRAEFEVAYREFTKK